MRSRTARASPFVLGLLVAVACAEGEVLDDVTDDVPFVASGGASGGEGGMTPPPPVSVGSGGMVTATGGAPPAGGAPVEPGACNAGLKRCGGICVAPSPASGCSLLDCSPCPAPAGAGTAVCRDGACAEEACTNCSAPDAGSGPPDPPPVDPDVQRCLSQTTEDACSRCVCEQCLAASLACGDSGQTQRDTACLAIIECGRQNHCTSIGCYCGGADLNTCATAPAGACVTEIQSAAGTSDFNTVANALSDTNHAVYLADQVGQCALGACAGPCGF